ncbi:MAG: type I-U CRISPR-associated RAMP protein Csb1/Cas7u [Myxococcales bacterium]|nr:type I-U CRISPR-associated RAMP protein Csb1/Cas7u [Myxococcota bacterium]MDW8280094.1 type I-U CRISPR-associated RAMP protein Csb1/Cas7u [Myxococcales bacterium]
MSTATELTLGVLRDAVRTAVAFRCRRRLQPAGGEGDKVFPPTFAGAVYAIEKRHVPGRPAPVPCVLLDSVQSQANRMEQALQEAIDAGKIVLPHVVVDFSEYDPSDTGTVEKEKLINSVGKITSLQVPHRLADAILRDSELNGTPFRDSDKGKALNRVSLMNATPLFELGPTALLFGMWDSTGPKGGLGPKFERAIVSEVVGIDAEWQDDYRARGVRRDPLEVRSAVKVIKSNTSWRLADEKDKKGAIEPSKINHSSVPFESKNSGVTIQYAEQTTTLSLIVLRRLRFPVNGITDENRDVAARTVLAALGLTAATLAFESGMGLRSRCLLWPEGPMTWELLDKPGQPPRLFASSSEQMIAMFKQAIDVAKEMKLPWPEEPVTLKPSKNLVELVRLSQMEATREEADTSRG